MYRTHDAIVKSPAMTSRTSSPLPARAPPRPAQTASQIMNVLSAIFFLVIDSIVEQFLYIQKIGYMPPIAIVSSTIFNVLVPIASSSSVIDDIISPYLIIIFATTLNVSSSNKLGAPLEGMQ